jgi:hypothetical protein
VRFSAASAGFIPANSPVRLKARYTTSSSRDEAFRAKQGRARPLGLLEEFADSLSVDKDLIGSTDNPSGCSPATSSISKPRSLMSICHAARNGPCFSDSDPESQAKCLVSAMSRELS